MPGGEGKGANAPSPCASLPKGMEDSALERVLNAIDKDSPAGARDYAIAVLMMAYGIRGIWLLGSNGVKMD